MYVSMYMHDYLCWHTYVCFFVSNRHCVQSKFTAVPIGTPYSVVVRPFWSFRIAVF